MSPSLAPVLVLHAAADRDVAWCLREALSGGLSVRKATGALNARLAFKWGHAPVPVLAFATLVQRCRRDGVPPRYSPAILEVTAEQIIVAGMIEIVAAMYRRWPAPRKQGVA